jgi:hypothetical protein
MPAAFYLVKIKMTDSKAHMDARRRDDSVDEEHFRPINRGWKLWHKLHFMERFADNDTALI